LELFDAIRNQDISEMFSKDNADMFTAKHVGSLAFMPPEICMISNGAISGRIADIWSMGVTLYSIIFGRLPFENRVILELFDAIRNQDISLPTDCDPNLVDILQRLLEKDPSKRISMNAIREHPWVTRCGIEPLPSMDENTTNLVGSSVEGKAATGITAPSGKMVTVTKAPTECRSEIGRNISVVLDSMPENIPTVEPAIRPQSELANSSMSSQPTSATRSVSRLFKFKDNVICADECTDGSNDLTEIVSDCHQPPGPTITSTKSYPQKESIFRCAPRASFIKKRATTASQSPLEEAFYLGIGISSDHPSPEEQDIPILSESPSATNVQVCECVC